MELARAAFKKWGKGILIAITGPVGILVVTAIKHWSKIKDGRREGVGRHQGRPRRRRGTPSRPSSAALWGVIVAVFKLSPVGIIAAHWAKIRAGVVAAWGAIVGAIARLRGARSRASSRAPTRSSSSIGSAIVSGIRQGISNGWGAFESWFKGLIGKPVQWAKNILHIGSPSRVFAEIGGNVADGLAVGMKNGQGAMVRRASRSSLGPRCRRSAARRLHGRRGRRRPLRGPARRRRRRADLRSPASAGRRGVTQAIVDATVDRAFRQLAAELGRR